MGIVVLSAGSNNADRVCSLLLLLQRLGGYAQVRQTYVLRWTSARSSRNVSDKELVTIQKNKIIHVLEKGERRTIPYRAMLTDYSVLGIIASSIGGM